MILLALLSCSRPPEAPEDLDALCAWLYTEHGDTEAVEAGLANLDVWLGLHGDEAAGGHELTGLTEVQVSDLDAREHSVEGILGVSVAFESQHPVESWVDALLVQDQDEILPEHYESYSRTWDTELGCFLDGSCERATSSEEVVASLPLGVTATNTTTNDYLLAAAPEGDAVVQRSWLPAPGRASLPGWEIVDQYYLNVLLPRSGGAWRMQASWMVHDQGVLTEAGLLSMSADGMRGLAEDTEAWMDGSW